MKIESVTPEYVDHLPDHLQEGLLYVCEEFELTAHKCCCGCGEDVYNKLGPAKWQLTRSPDGSVSLFPSIGNWKYACRSHYWIRNNRAIDAGEMNEAAIDAVQRRDKLDREAHIASVNARSDVEERTTWWSRVRSRVSEVLRRLRELWTR